MLWYKAWLETRWRFLVGLAILMISACGTVFIYPQVQRLIPLAPSVDAGGELGRRVQEAVQLSREYRGYIWSQWFRQNLIQTWTVFAALLGAGGLVPQSSGGAVLYTLSMPASRNRLLGVRAATGLVELVALAVVPSLLIPLLSPAVGDSYSLVDALAHSACLFLGGAVFFGLAVLLSTVFADIWRPLLIALAVAAVIAVGEQFVRDVSSLGIFRLMNGEAYFRTRHVPWIGLSVTTAATMAMLYGAASSLERRDF